jgi:hypothetical protein
MTDGQEMREVRELDHIYSNLRFNREGGHHRPFLRKDAPEESTSWAHFCRLRALLHREDLWSDRELFLEAQFQFWHAPLSRKDMVSPPPNNLYGTKAWNRWKAYQRAKGRTHELSENQYRKVVGATLAGPYEEAFEQSAHTMKQKVQAGFDREEIFSNFTEQFSSYFIAVDPVAWAILEEDEDHFGVAVRQAYRKLERNKNLRRTLERLGRKCLKEEEKVMLRTGRKRSRLITIAHAIDGDGPT